MYRKMLVFWQIRNFFNIYSYTSENIELNIQGEPQTLTSRTRKTNTVCLKLLIKLFKQNFKAKIKFKFKHKNYFN